MGREKTMRELCEKAIVSLVLIGTLYPVAGCAQKQETVQSPASAGEAVAPASKAILSPEWVVRLPQARSARQLIVVAALAQTTATISVHEKAEDGQWHEVLATPGFIGKNGLGKTKEGDGKTPVGAFVIDKAFGIAPDPGCHMPYLQVDENIYWSGDERKGMRYNELVDIRNYPGLNAKASERIVDYQEPYQYVLNMGYNPECAAGRGSALFLHCFGRYNPYTGGCVAIPEAQMRRVMQWIRPGCVIVINTQKQLKGER